MVSCGGQTTFVISDGGEIWAAGSGQKGSLGLGPKTFSTQQRFQKVEINAKFDWVASGFESSSAICKETGAVYVWGCAKNGMFGRIQQNVFTPLAVKARLIISRTKIDIEIKNILDQTGFKLTNKAIRTSNGGWNSLVVEDTESPMTSFPTVSANAARARRKNNRILATLPPLTKTLDKEVLDEMRKIIHR